MGASAWWRWQSIRRRGWGALAGELALPFPVYADPQHRLAGALGVYNLLRDGVAAPSVFVASSTGRIVWRYVGKGAADRPPVEEVLRQAMKAKEDTGAPGRA